MHPPPLRARTASRPCLLTTPSGVWSFLEIDMTHASRLAVLALPLVQVSCSGTDPSHVDSHNAGGAESQVRGGSGNSSDAGTSKGGAVTESSREVGGASMSSSRANAGGVDQSGAGGSKPSTVNASGGAAAATSKGQFGGASGKGTTNTQSGGASTKTKDSVAQGGMTNATSVSGAVGGSNRGGTTSAPKSTSSGGGSNTSGASSGACTESSCGSHKWPCWRMPNPASLNLPNPQSYTDLGNGTVRDNVTCLVWEKANPATKGDLEANRKRCEDLAASGYAGFDDWRLPTRVEMASITDITRGSTGYPTAFTVTGGYYATGSLWYKTILTDKDSTSGNEVNRVWGYGTNGFTSNAIVRTDQNMVARCVRGNGPGEALDEYAVEPPDHYTVTGSGKDAVVKDKYTGLIWQQTYSSARMPWAQASSYCDEQTTGGLSNWRVPTLNELASTVNEALVAPAINRTVFPSTNGSCDPDGWFWAAEASKVGGTAWGLSYCDGYTGANSGTSSSAWNYFVDGWVRCVHD